MHKLRILNRYICQQVYLAQPSLPRRKNRVCSDYTPKASLIAIGLPQPRKGAESTSPQLCMLTQTTNVQGFEDWQNPSSTGGTSGLAINADWLTRTLELRSDARYIIVVEKDGVFNRMVEDGFHDRLCQRCT